MVGKAPWFPYGNTNVFLIINIAYENENCGQIPSGRMSNCVQIPHCGRLRRLDSPSKIVKSCKKLKMHEMMYNYVWYLSQVIKAGSSRFQAHRLNIITYNDNYDVQSSNSLKPSNTIKVNNIEWFWTINNRFQSKLCHFLGFNKPKMALTAGYPL